MPHDAHSHVPGNDGAVDPNNVPGLTFQHPVNPLSSKDLHWSLLTSTFGHMEYDTNFNASAFSDFPLEEFDIAMSAELFACLDGETQSCCQI